MRTLLRAVLAAGLGYLLGSVPSADVATRLAGGPDLRTAGSGNPGAANAAQVLGARYGLTVLAVDIAKGAGAAMAGRVLHGPAVAQVASSSAVIGHCFPPWSGFKGGKGVATGVGQVLATFPAYFPIDVGVALATAVVPWWRQRAFAATAVASAAWVAGGVLWWRKGWPNAYGPEPRASLPLASAVSSAVIMAKFVQGSRSRATGSGNGA